MDLPLCILADAEKEQKREYAKRHPHSLAFQPHITNDEVSLEECLLELKLENVVDDAVRMVAARRTAYLNTTRSADV